MFLQSLKAHQRCFEALPQIAPEVDRAARAMIETLQRGGKILICGNGGSAADAQHLAAELVGRFEAERRALPAVALTTDSSILTAVANDYDFSGVFARQVDALGRPGDLLLGISTSGRSENVGEAFKTATGRDMATVGLLGTDGGFLKSLCATPVVVPAERTARIQEAHVFILHVWAATIEETLASTGASQ